MPKVVINQSFGGFSLSDEGRLEYAIRSHTYHLAGLPSPWDFDRTDPVLVAMVAEDSEKYSGRRAYLTVVEVPDDVSWHIADYDGREHVSENHRTWR